MATVVIGLLGLVAVLYVLGELRDARAKADALKVRGDVLRAERDRASADLLESERRRIKESEDYESIIRDKNQALARSREHVDHLARLAGPAGARWLWDQRMQMSGTIHPKDGDRQPASNVPPPTPPGKAGPAKDG